MIGQTKKEGRRNLLLVGAAVVLVAAIGATWIQRSSSANSDKVDSTLTAASEAAKRSGDSVAALAAAALSRGGMTPAQIADKNQGVVVKIEVAWKLIETRTGSQLYRKVLRNRYKGSDGKEYVFIDNGRQWVPAYVQTASDDVEPYMTDDASSGIAIGGIISGTGFVVTRDGFIVTNRHIAAPWRAQYQSLDPRGDMGPLVDGQGNPILDSNGMPTIVEAPSMWVPSESKQDGSKGLRERFEGRMDELLVAFPSNTTRIPAQVARVSDRHDVALIKISSPQQLPMAELNDNYTTAALGDPVVVMGYPGVSAPKIERIGQKIMMLGDVQVRDVPEPTLSVGNIGKILRTPEDQGGSRQQISVFGDSYQLTINSTGGGNSGGPMFDNTGRVIGIYSWGRTTDAQVSFAIPIRYAIELMTVSPTSR